MFSGLAVLLASLIGVKTYDHYSRKRSKGMRKPRPPRTPGRSVMGETNIDESPEVCDHYFKTGALSLGLALLARSLPVLNLLSLALIIYTCIPILNRGLRQVLQKRAVGHDLLYSTYIMLAFITRQQMFIALGVFFYHSGAKILSMAQAMSKPLVSSLVERQSETVWIIKEGVELETPLEQVVAGDIVQIRAGEIIPVDGVILDGIAMIDQHALTGESQPAEKEAGATVLSSTLVVSGRIRVQVTKAGKDTTISKITQILNNTSAYTTSIQLKGEEWSNYIAIPVLALTAIAIPTKGLLTATTVSHSTFGNRLRIAAPIGTLSYLHEALNTGLLIKDGRVIEELDQVDTVLFDKTGTLTHEQPEVGKIICARDRYSQMDILAYAATAEQKLTHPLARAIQQKAKELCLDLPSVEDSNFTIGHGISVAIGSKLVRVGSLRFMRAERVGIPTLITKALCQADSEGVSLMLVAVDTEVEGAIEIVSSLRSEVEQTLKGLRERGVTHISIVSGDHEIPTRRLAESLAMDSYFSEVLPEQKASIVERLQQQGKKVCYVGDGINDALAMNQANVSVSLSGATAIATDTAQAVLMDGTLTHLCDLFDAAHKLKNNLWRSLALVTAPTIASIGGAFFWGLKLGGSYLLIYSTFALALANAMMPSLKRLGEQGKTKTRPPQSQGDRRRHGANKAPERNAVNAN